MIIWIVIGTYYQFDLLSVFLPIAMYQVIITFTLCFIVITYWEVPNFEKALSLLVFILWGMGKAMLSICEVGYSNLASLYLMEIIFSNILNFCIFIIYLHKTRSVIDMADRLYRIIAENATDVIFYYKLKPQPAFIYITPSVEEMTGYAPKDFYTDSKFYLQLVPSSQFKDISAIFHANQEDIGEPYSRVFQIIHKNGTSTWAEFNISTLYEAGEAVAVEGIIRDITRMKNAENELIASKRSRELLLSYVSHELKTPITSILGYINAIKDDTIKDIKQIEDAIDIIFAKSLTMERLINDLFQLSKLETKQFSMQFMRIEANELAIDLISRHKLDIKAAQLTLSYKIDREALSNKYLIIDLERIDQVFANFISNAIKYTKEKDRIIIKFGIDSAKENFYVSVTDNGCGIARDDLPHIFNRFYMSSTGSEEKRMSGTGLGLTISKEIIAAHRGTIYAKSRLGKGSTFTFTIPLYKD
ncbi:MAG: PAS domain-containing sensor histidine kinase [Eubacteriales bacterium]|nr:PAS domain-containing sensor histidine kinase [Eubacteriales bacterium]